MSKFICDTCDYQTDRKSSLLSHNKSQKHIKKSNRLQQNNTFVNQHDNRLSTNNIKSIKLPTNSLYTCKYCNGEFSSRQARSRHEKDRCSIKLEQEKNETQEKTIVNFLKEQVDSLKEQLEFTKSEIKMYQKYIDSNCEIASKSVSAVNFIMSYFTGAPLLEPIQDCEKLLLGERERKDLESILIYRYREKTLHKYIADLIEDVYKKDTPSTQSLWTSDVSRLTYVVNTVVKNVSGWHVDKGGLIVKDKLIQPIIDFMITIINNYYRVMSINFKNKIYDGDRDYTLHKMQYCYELAEALELGKLTDDIVKCLAPKFHINRNLRLEENKKIFLQYDESVSIN
jgi:hypothetical protein